MRFLVKLFRIQHCFCLVSLPHAVDSFFSVLTWIDVLNYVIFVSNFQGKCCRSVERIQSIHVFYTQWQTRLAYLILVLCISQYPFCRWPKKKKKEGGSLFSLFFFFFVISLIYNFLEGKKWWYRITEKITWYLGKYQAVVCVVNQTKRGKKKKLFAQQSLGAKRRKKTGFQKKSSKHSKCWN